MAPRMVRSEAELIATIRARSEQARSGSTGSGKAGAGQAGIRLRRSGKQQVVALGIGDDCAVLRPRPGEELVVTTDLSLEGVHFRRDWHPPESVGHRCLARGLSDLAAMGARPEAAFLSLALPAELTGVWLDRFFDGLFALASRAMVTLAGGDMAQSPGIQGRGRQTASGLVVADIILTGSVPAGRALLRSGARPGDVIYVTGTLGGAAAELRALEAAPKRFQRSTAAAGGHPHLYPEPRLAAGRRLLRLAMASAAIDVSDGLSTDLSHVCTESGVSAELEAAALPVDARATLEDALHGGEDYELLFTARPRAAVPARLGGVAVQAIGTVRKRGRAPLVTMRLAKGRQVALNAGGWEHFKRSR